MQMNLMISRKFVLSAALAATVAIASGGLAQDGPVTKLEVLGRALRLEPAWRAGYHQEYVPAGMTLGEEVAGTVWVAWPDRAHFRAGEPLDRIMGLEGRRVRLVDLGTPSCDDHVLNDAEWARIPLAAVLDPRTAVDHFTIVDRGSDGLTLIPREPGGVARVDVRLGEDDLPNRVVIVDPAGSRNTLDFEDWQPASPPSDGGWLPAPPTGVDCLED